MIVFVYLAAVVAANLSAATFGPNITIINAFLFIGLDLTLRDRLHEKWRGDFRRMGLLILTGSVLAWAINPAARNIAIASAAAFAVAGVIDWAVYQLLHDRHRLVRMNGSNVVSALADSIVFPTVAFGGFLPLITLGQWAAKVFGGAIWAWLVHRSTLPNR